MKFSKLLKGFLVTLGMVLTVSFMIGLVLFVLFLPIEHVTLFLNPLQAEFFIHNRPYRVSFITITPPSIPHQKTSPSASDLPPRLTLTPSPQPPETDLPTETLLPSETPLPTETFTFTPSATRTKRPTHTPPPTKEPTQTAAPIVMPTYLPSSLSAYISNIVGHRQNYTLDCEARSAVDMASYLGTSIDESDFLNKLPRSDDPNEGFVGNLGDPRGQVPPRSYGVHAAPIAALLRSYGLNASDQHGMGFETLKSEIAAGRPVMVWVIGNTVTGFRSTYTPSNGHTTVVAPYEHTVLVIGYNQDTVTLLDEDTVYNRSTYIFLNSWAVLGNMAVTISP